MNYKQQTLAVSGQTLTYNLAYRTQKNIILKVREGKIFITAPECAQNWEIEQIIYRNLGLIQKSQNNYERQAKYDFFATEPWIKIFNQFVKVVLVDDNIRTKMVNEVIYMHNYLDNDEQLKRLYVFLSREYKHWFINQTQEWSLKMGLEFKNLSIKMMSMKWGVCYPYSQKLLFNPKLLHFSPEIIDYVIIHELAHLKYPNHSKQFWNTVAQYAPNYQERKEILNISGI